MSSFVKKTLKSGLTREFLKATLYDHYGNRPLYHHLGRFLDPNFLSNNFLSYELTVTFLSCTQACGSPPGSRLGSQAQKREPQESRRSAHLLPVSSKISYLDLLGTQLSKPK